jgi:phosphoribosylformimino-5-aminoimidazole carboxamide ribotide isomerase
MIIPSIDLVNGKIVKLEQGEKKKIELRANPLKIAKKFSNCKEVQVIDLDAAMGIGNNFQLVKKLCKVVNARVGGGIKSIKKARELIEAGAKKVIIGTRAEKKFLQRLCKAIGKEKLIIALDTKGGKVVTKGWKKSTKMTPFQLAKQLQAYCSEFLYTYVDMEGLMSGTDFETIKKLKRITTNRLTAAGGIASEVEVKKLENIGVDAVIGMAIYTGKIKLRD